MINKAKFFLVIVTCGVLTSCGGGSDDNATNTGGSDDDDRTLSGYVLDGAVEASRVCYDLNADSQCTAEDSYVTTNSEGYFEINLRDDYQLIADVRHSESKDTDYTSGSPDYDYVMQAFDQGRDIVVISPLSTFMSYQKNIKGESEETIVSDIVSIIAAHEQYAYSQEVETAYEYTEIIQGNFIQGRESDDTHLADYNTRLHNINEVLAREMQESQAVWEDRFYSGELNLDSTDWNANSDVIVTNSYGTTFENFEIIVEEVTAFDYREFNAREVSDSIWMDVPDISNIQSLLSFIDTQISLSEEFSGSTYRHSITDESTDSVVFGYYVFSPEAISYYHESEIMGERSCFFATSPFADELSGVSESDFISQLNTAFSEINASVPGISYSSLQAVSKPPVNCSSFSSLLDNFNTTSDLSNASVGQLYQPTSACVDTVDEEGKCRTLPAVIAQGPSAVKTTSLSNGDLAPATLNTCNYGGRQYAINPCRNTEKN